MELETINKLYLELSQIATAKTAREIELEACSKEDAVNILRVLMFDHEKGWGKISSGLTHDFNSGLNSFNLRFDDDTEHCISFKVEEI